MKALLEKNIDLLFRRKCDFCHGMSEFGHRCSECKSKWYCSKTCQTSDWNVHKRLCNRYKQSALFTSPSSKELHHYLSSKISSNHTSCAILNYGFEPQSNNHPGYHSQEREEVVQDIFMTSSTTSKNVIKSERLQTEPKMETITIILNLCFLGIHIGVPTYTAYSLLCFILSLLDFNL